MKKLKLGWIGFIDHESTVFWDQCRSLRAIGYQGMELAEFLLDLPGGYENIKRLNEIGICALTVLPEMEQLRENGVEAFIEKAKDARCGQYCSPLLLYHRQLSRENGQL